MLKLLRQNFAQADRQIFDGIVGEASEQDVIDLRGLFGDGGHDGGMAVAVEIDPPGRNAVDEAATVRGV